MRNLLKQEKGITLVELLTVLIIGSIIMVLIMGIFSNGHKQYSSQTAKAEQLNDLRYAAKVITKEIRKADKVEANCSSLKLGTDTPIIYTFKNKRILQNGATLISDIEVFSVCWVDGDKQFLKIKIESIEIKGQKQEVETEIFIREGVAVE